ncbi:hypothetical protein J2X73_002534 [Novosphingobium sp. 1748]|uniref:hypothetical protein n=1 Tax=Novosphingobium sp. 1748 TaxID=2817760 RepID=UPI002856459B|nr:hypothetical protein [Novosphingobium sp. 1748]MDR6708163.1 hypothetical protein [Novosphingobium sp. 1748]
MVAAMRLCLTADREELVAEGDPRAAFLYASVGDEIPQSAVEKFGLVDGKLPENDGDLAEVERLAAVEAAANAQRLADEAAAAEAQRKADEEAAAIEAKRVADEAAAAEAAKKAAEVSAENEGSGDKENGEGTTKEAKPGKTKG